MTDEELAEKYRKSLKQKLIDEDEFERLEMFDENVEEAYLAGLKAGRPQWHDLRKDQNDLPLNTAPVLCLGSTGFIVCKYIGGSWIDNQTIELIPKYIDIYKWYEIEDTEE